MEWITTIASIGGVLVALYGVVVAKDQLQKLRETLRIDGLMAVLAIEAEIGKRKLYCDETSIEIKRLQMQASPDDSEIKLLREKLNSGVEQWLNALERLCFCIIKGYVPERDWRAEYRDYLAGVVNSQKSLFGTSTKYINIERLYKKWRSE